MARQWIWGITALLLGTSTIATAQTCASPVPFRTPWPGPTASGTTCGGTDSVSLYCGALDSANKNDAIFSISLAPAGPLRTMTQLGISNVSGIGFAPIVVLYSAACASGDGCAATGDGSNALSFVPVPGGSYFLAVSAGPLDGSGSCGTFTITANGTVPVQLQHFSIE